MIHVSIKQLPEAGVDEASTSRFALFICLSFIYLSSFDIPIFECPEAYGHETPRDFLCGRNPWLARQLHLKSAAQTPKRH